MTTRQDSQRCRYRLAVLCLGPRRTARPPLVRRLQVTIVVRRGRWHAAVAIVIFTASTCFAVLLSSSLPCRLIWRVVVTALTGVVAAIFLLATARAFARAEFGMRQRGRRCC